MQPGLRSLHGRQGQTDLQRILSLSPSALYWPALATMTVATNGTGAAPTSGQLVGRIMDLSGNGNDLIAGTWASPSDAARANYVIQTDPALYNVSGQPELATVASQSGVAIGGPAFTNYRIITGLPPSKLYRITFTVSDYSGTGDVGVAGNVASFEPDLPQAQCARVSNGNVDCVGYFVGSNLDFYTRSTNTCNFTNISVKEIPVSQYKYALSFGGVDDYYSLLNAISITESMTVVRAFKRASAGISSFGIGESSATTQRDFTWASTNDITSGLGASNALLQSGNTSTGSFVGVSRRNASTEIIRLNGAQNGSRTAATVSGSFNQLGRLGPSAFGIGEISFLAVFPTELTGANLALVEQIAAATNGAVLA